jgi:hypothetical protein
MGLERRKGSRNLYRYGKKRCPNGKIVSVYLGKHLPDVPPEDEGSEPPAPELQGVAQDVAQDADGPCATAQPTPAQPLTAPPPEDPWAKYLRPRAPKRRYRRS